MKLVLLPGLDGTGKLFNPLIRILPDTIDPIVISYPSNEMLNYNEIATYIMERLPADNFVLMCESFSGPVAYQLASKAPDNLKAIIFVATFLDNPRPLLLNLSKLLPCKLFLALPLPKTVIKFFMLGHDAGDKVLKLCQSVIKTVPAKILSFRLGEISKLKLNNSKCSIQTTYIQATKDRLVPAKCIEAFYSNFSNLNVVQVNGPHFIIQAKPMACLKIIENSINDL